MPSHPGGPDGPESKTDEIPNSPVPPTVAGRGFLPPVRVWVIAVLCLVVAAVIQTWGVLGDRAVVNAITLACGLAACLVPASWFVFYSSYPRWFRLGSAVCVILTLAAGLALFKVEHVSGEMVPTFRLRWARAPDELLEVPAFQKLSRQISLATTTRDDFPQFLGPQRNLRVDHIALDRDWSARPPRLLWRQPIGAGWSAFSVVNGFAVTLEQRGPEELVTCYGVRTGELLWAHGVRTRHDTTLGGVGPRSTPTIHEGKVYTLGATGRLHCLDGASGRVIWSDDLLRRYHIDPAQDEKGVGWGRAASPLIVDDLLVVPAGGPRGGPYVSLAAFQKDTGELVWEGGARQVSFSSPVLATLCEVRQILVVNEDNVSAHDPRDGHVFWEYPWSGSSTSSASCSQPVMAGNDRVLLSKAYGGGAALLQISASPERTFQAAAIWHETSLLKTKFTNVVVRDACAYGLSDGILECVDLDRGIRKWKRGRYGHGQILSVGDLLLVQAETGEVLLVEATPRRSGELGSIPALQGQTWNNLCLFGPLLLARNAEQAACFELPTVAPQP